MKYAPDNLSSITSSLRFPWKVRIISTFIRGSKLCKDTRIVNGRTCLASASCSLDAWLQDTLKFLRLVFLLYSWVLFLWRPLPQKGKDYMHLCIVCYSPKWAFPNWCIIPLTVLSCLGGASKLLSKVVTAQHWNREDGGIQIVFLAYFPQS